MDTLTKGGDDRSAGGTAEAGVTSGSKKSTHAQVNCDLLYSADRLEKSTNDSQNDAATTQTTPSSKQTSISSTIVSLYHTLVPPGGHISSAFNLASGTLGIGIVSMPSGFNSAGIVLGVVLMLFSGFLLISSYYFLGLALQLSDSHTWEELGRKLFFRGADYVIAFIVAFYLTGTMLAYVVAAHDLVQPFLLGDGVHPFFKSPHGHRIVTAIVWLCCMFIPSLPLRVNSLRYLAIVGVSFIGLFVIAVIQQSVEHKMKHVHEMKLFSNGVNAVNGFTLFLFALNAHGTGVKVHSEMKHRTGLNMAKAGSASVLSVSVLYFLVGFFGYADIGPSVTGSLFPYYDVLGHAFLIVVYIGVLFKICVAYALCMQTCRISVCYVFKKNVDTLSFWQYSSITLLLSLTTFIMGVFIPSINIVFNLLGSICGGTLALMFPALLCMYSGGWTAKNVGWTRLILTYILVIVGVIAVVLGTSMTIYQLL